MSEPIRITDAELSDPKVDEVLAQEARLRGAWAEDDAGSETVGKVARRVAPKVRSGSGLYVTGVAFTALLGLVGGLAGWALFEPFVDDSDETASILLFLMIVSVAAGISTAVALGDGILSRAWLRTLRSGGIGLGVGTVGGLAVSVVANIVYGFGVIGFVLVLSVNSSLRRQVESDPENLPFALVVGVMSARSMAWCFLGAVAGLGPGLIQRSRDLITVGILGGVVGGFLGGVVFDPIAFGFGSVETSRGLGFGLVGLLTGLGIGLVEQLSKDAWLYMQDGPLAGKQFVLYKDPTRIGSSPKCDLYIFKDSAVSPEHARLLRSGGAHEIEAADGGVFVNGAPVRRERLKDGDEIAIGGARLRYYVRKKKRQRIK